MEISNWNTAILALCLTVSTSVFLAPSAHSQQAESTQEANVDIIVMRTAEQAQAVLNELKAGTDFGVLAK
jgi:hypothetical protein